MERTARCVGFVWLGVVATVTACSPSRNCHAIGADAGVRMTGGPARASVRICDRTACGTGDLIRGQGFVRLTSLESAHAVELTATYSTAMRDVATRVRVVPVRFEPNGADCPPSVASVNLHFDAAGHASE